jgi:hypothetical protein
MHIIVNGNNRSILIKFTHITYIKIRVFPDYVEIDILYECHTVTLRNTNDLNRYNFKNNEILEHISKRHKNLDICEQELLAAIEILRGFTF